MKLTKEDILKRSVYKQIVTLHENIRLRVTSHKTLLIDPETGEHTLSDDVDAPEDTELTEICSEILAEYLDIPPKAVRYFVAIFMSVYSDRGSYMSEYSKPGSYRSMCTEGSIPFSDFVEGQAILDLLISKSLISTSSQFAFTNKRMDEETYMVNPRIVHCILRNEPIKTLPTKDIFDGYQFVVAIYEFFTIYSLPSYEALLINTVKDMEEKYQRLPFVNKVMSTIKEFEDRILFYLICASELKGNYWRSYNDMLEAIHTDISKNLNQANSLLSGKNKLIEADWIFINKYRESFGLTATGRELFYQQHTCLQVGLYFPYLEQICFPEEIDYKKLFFNAETQSQLERLKKATAPDTVRKLKKAFQQTHNTQGFCFLLEGEAGTGKKEFVKQLAKEHSYLLMEVDLSFLSSLDEALIDKKIRETFDIFDAVCRTQPFSPVLLFTGIDKLIQKDSIKGWSNLEKAIKANEGIIFITSDIKLSSYKEYDSLFLQKVSVPLSSVEIRRKIWEDRCPQLSEIQYQELAETFSFTGETIESIARKSVYSAIINKNADTQLDEIKHFCQEALETLF
ncbi:MAG: hypothetical protein RR303_03115 [Bacteroidales bacterium]